MRLYLDDDSADARLIELLKKDGHDVHVPLTTGQARSVHDAEHLANAIRSNRVMVTKNYRDFNLLGKLVIASGGTYPGILIVRVDGTPRDMTLSQVVTAVGNVERDPSGVVGKTVILNQRRVF